MPLFMSYCLTLNIIWPVTGIGLTGLEQLSNRELHITFIFVVFSPLSINICTDILVFSVTPLV